MKIYNYFKITSQEFRLKKITEIRNYFLKEIEQNELISRKHKKVCATLNYIEHFFILASTITRSISIYDFASLLGFCYRNCEFCNRDKNLWIAAGIKKYKSIIEKKKKKYDKLLLAKSKLNSTEVLISTALIDSVISHLNLF